MPAKRNKAKGKRYTASEKARALQLYKEYGPAQTSRRLGIPYETIRRWARDAGVTASSTPHADTAKAHAVAAQRASKKWADIREQEADEAAAAAISARERLLDVLISDDPQMIRAVVGAYDTLIQNAEKLSGQATERIAIWAEHDLDTELRNLVKAVEDKRRTELPASKKRLQAEQADEILVPADYES